MPLDFRVKHIQTTLISTGSWIKGHARLHSLVALLVFAVGLGATVYYWNNLKQSVAADRDVAFDRRAQSISNAAGTRMQLYENFLRGSAGLFQVKDFISQKDWDQYHQSYNSKAMYPDIESIGLTRYLPNDELPDFLDRKTVADEEQFAVTPQGKRAVYAPVSLVVAYAAGDTQTKGYDTYTDPILRAAMDRAADTGRPTATGKIPSTRDNPAIILYMPIYHKDMPITTPVERRAALLGFSHMVIDAQTFLEAVLASAQSTHTALHVVDPSLDAKQGLMFEGEQFAAISQQKGSKTRSSTIEIYGYRWRTTLTASPDILSAYERRLPDQAIWRGVLSSLFFAVLVWYLITDRERKYARQKQEEVQSAKDDLLSLASHQLRTPATVVKQYVGMLLQGYAGQLTKKQIAMLTDAYESNERQLNIINQLLYVARLDAGRIVLRYEKANISRLLRDVVHDQHTALMERNQQITLKLPKRDVMAELDPHYMRMAFENILSNAIKYTPPYGRLTLSARRLPGSIIIRMADTGVGIETSLQDTIFDKFTRVENVLSNDVNGSGVGLYLTRQVVELHRGTIEVRSQPGKGSTFIIRIPIK